MTAPRQTVFDQSHYLKLIEARGETIRRMVSELKPVLNLSTALDAGCGLGFFSKMLQDAGLNVHAFDGRIENIEEARTRFPGISFAQGDIENSEIRKLGQFDLVLCFGLLYHLENPFSAIRNLRAVTRNALLLESMCFPDEEPWMLLREEPSLDDQSLTDVAFYATEGCLVKMLYRAGFAYVYRIAALPDHDDFRETSDHTRCRTVLLAADHSISLPGLELLPEPKERENPWEKLPPTKTILTRRVKSFLASPAKAKYASLARRLHRWFPWAAVPVRLSYGAWWLARNDHVSQPILDGNFETAEYSFVRSFVQPGMTVLDIGAHHGFYTLLSARLVGSAGQVFAFEPSPRERKALQRHVRLNRCSNVRVQASALGVEKKEASLYVVEGSQTGCNSLRPPIVLSKTSSVAVQVVSLDDWLSGQQLGRVDFIKLDVEGGELEVLKGAANLLTRRPRPVILAEVQDIRTQAWGYKAKDVIDHLRAKGYTWFRLSQDGSTEELNTKQLEFDGNFVAVPEERRDLDGRIPGS